MLLTLLPYLAAALNLILTLALFFAMQRTLWRLRSRVVTEAALNRVTDRLTGDLNGLNVKLSELETTTGQRETGAVVLGSGLNTGLRSKVLKMHRMGQTLDRIAEVLRVPKGEVELLVKVHRIVMRPYEQTSDTVLQHEKDQKSLNPARKPAIQQQA